MGDLENFLLRTTVFTRMLTLNLNKKNKKTL